MNRGETPERAASAEEASESLIDRHSHFDGVYISARDLRIAGMAEGEIRCEGTVTIVEGASVSASVNARNVVLAGTADGEIVCQDHFLLRPTGTMRGKVRAASLSVEEGAFFQGEFRMAVDEVDQGPTAAPESPVAEPEAREADTGRGSFWDRPTSTDVGSTSDEEVTPVVSEETFVGEEEAASVL